MKTLKEKIEVMQAALEGKTIQWRDSDNGWTDTEDATWAWHVNDYRVKPQPPAKKLVAMQLEDYPPMFWVRRIGAEQYALCTGIHGGFLSFSSSISGFFGPFLVTVHTLSGIDVKDPRPCEYSVDRKTWLPCTKEVDA